MMSPHHWNPTFNFKKPLSLMLLHIVLTASCCFLVHRGSYSCIVGNIFVWKYEYLTNNNNRSIVFRQKYMATEMFLFKRGVTSTWPAPPCPHPSSRSGSPGDTTTWTSTGEQEEHRPRVLILIFRSTRGGIAIVTEKRRRTSVLLMYRYIIVLLIVSPYKALSRAVTTDTGNYSCEPSNAESDTVQVHVLEGTGIS